MITNNNFNVLSSSLKKIHKNEITDTQLCARIASLLRYPDDTGLSKLINFLAINSHPKINESNIVAIDQKKLIALCNSYFTTNEFNEICIKKFIDFIRDSHNWPSCLHSNLNSKVEEFNNHRYGDYFPIFAKIKRTDKHEVDGRMNYDELDLRGADLRGLNLKSGYLHTNNFSNKDMSNAILNGEQLHQNKTWEKTNFSGANLGTVHDIHTIKFNGAGFNRHNKSIFSNETKITLGFSNIDMDFNHLANTSGSILTFIDSIENASNLKINLMHQVVDYLSNKDINSIQDSLEDILYKDPIYLNDPKIKAFIVNKLLNNKIETANIQKVEFRELEISIIINHFIDLNDKESQDFIIKNSACINQIICYSKININCSNDLKLLITKLEIKYLESYVFKNFTQEFKAVYIDINDISKANNLIFIDSTSETLLVVSYDYYRRWVIGDTNIDCPIDNAIILNKNNEAGHLTITESESVLQLFPLLLTQFKYEQRQSGFLKLINLLNLDELKNNFIQATKTKNYKIKLNNSNNVKKLALIFEKTVIDNRTEQEQQLNTVDHIICQADSERTYNITLTNEHFAAIMEAYGLANAEPTKQAEILLCLIIIFAKYSSSHIFGLENDSPIPLRNYATALLNKVVTLNPLLIENNRLIEWKNALLGINNAFTCTGALASKMIDKTKTICPNLLAAILPPTWT